MNQTSVGRFPKYFGSKASILSCTPGSGADPPQSAWYIGCLELRVDSKLTENHTPGKTTTKLSSL